MFDRTKQLRLRRALKKQRRAVENAAQIADDSFENNVVTRFHRLKKVWRFTAGWMTLVLLLAVLSVTQTIGLNKLYQTEQPVPGGVYNEGLVGTFGNTNPIYASGPVDVAISKLVFSGLLKYDAENHLVGDLAKSYDVDDSGKNYTIRLRDNLRWHDGRPLNADDVMFTFATIQNPDAESPLMNSWRGVTLTKIDDKTVRFSLASPLAPFVYSLTTGIIPKHVLSEIPPTELRSHSFGTTNPIGSGPYAWSDLELKNGAAPNEETSIIALKPFKNYHFGTPKLDRFLVHTFNKDEHLREAFVNRSVNAAAGLSEVPNAVLDLKQTHLYSFDTTAIYMIFLKTSEGVLNDTNVRQSLARATSRADIVDKVGTALRPVRSVILPGQVGYDRKYDQPMHSPTEAAKILDEAGWKTGRNNIRYKDGRPLSIQISSEDTPQNRQILKSVVSSWKEVGIDVKPVFQESSSFQTALGAHTYEALLYGISIGADPDVYAYWHSSQAGATSPIRLNFSEYRNDTADKSLEAGRTRLEPDVRTIKYQPFLQSWQQDNPAIALFQPRKYYITRGQVYGLNEHTINSDADRYYSAWQWQIHTAGVTKK